MKRNLFLARVSYAGTQRWTQLRNTNTLGAITPLPSL